MIATSIINWLMATGYALYVLVGLGAAALGGVIVWLWLRHKQVVAIAACESAMNGQIVQLSQCLATAQEKNTRIPELELNLSGAQQETRAYRDQHAKATNRIAALETQLEAERKTTTEKLNVLEEAQKRFTDAFKALSADALKENNSSFLELAKTTLEKTHETAKHDLEKRQG